MQGRGVNKEKVCVCLSSVLLVVLTQYSGCTCSTRFGATSSWSHPCSGPETPSKVKRSFKKHSPAEERSLGPTRPTMYFLERNHDHVTRLTCRYSALLLYHFSQFSSTCYTLHRCRNFHFSTSRKWPLQLFFFGREAGFFLNFLSFFRPFFFSLPKWFRYMARLTVTYVTFWRFRRVRYTLLPNWLKWYSTSGFQVWRVMVPYY